MKVIYVYEKRPYSEAAGAHIVAPSHLPPPPEGPGLVNLLHVLDRVRKCKMAPSARGHVNLLHVAGTGQFTTRFRQGEKM